MKKYLFSLLFLSLLGLPYFWYWEDCSVYENLINEVDNQINEMKIMARKKNTALLDDQIIPALANTPWYSDKYKSLMQDREKAVKYRDECLVNQSSNSSSSSTSNYSSSYTSSYSNNSNTATAFDVLKSSLKDSFEAKDNKDYDSALKYTLQAYDVCNNFKSSDSRMNSICDEIPELLWSLYYIAWTEIKKDWDYKKAITYYTEWIKYVPEKDSFYLWLWTIAFEEERYDDAIDFFTTGKKYAKNQDDIDSYDKFIKSSQNALSHTNTTDKKESDTNVEIECDEWYIPDETQTKCVKYSLQQVDLNCKTWYSPLSFVWEDWETCECPEGYFADSENTNYCVIDRSQKSLSSRLLNTSDAECDNTAVILSCNDDPTWDSCPAVCLELYDAITWMYDNELTIYKDPKQFWVYNEMTREQSSKFFSNFYKTVFEKPLIMPSENPFNDIDNADPTLIDYIKYSYNLWLFKGTNWKFMPFNSITKAQSLAVIIRMIAWVLDESWTKWYSEYLRRAENLNLLDNITYSFETLDNENIKRWDVALILYRLYLSI